MNQAHYIYWVLYFYCYVLIYNKIVTELAVMQNQWEPCACFPVPRRSRLWVMGDGDTRRVWPVSSPLRSLAVAAVTAENPASQRWGAGNGSRLLSAFVTVSGCSAFNPERTES